MTSPRPDQAVTTKWPWPLILTSCVTAALAACAGADAQVQLPPKHVAPPAAVSRTLPPTARQQVVAAFTGYTAALGNAEKSRSKRTARQLLRPYLAASRIDGLVDAMSTIWATGDDFYGPDVVHISSVTVRGRRAFVHDCDNTSGMGLENAATGESVPGSGGASHDNIVTRLDLVHGNWLVEFQLVEDVPCTA
jgi:hypothetical protein